MQPNDGNAETQLRLLAEGQRRTEQRLIALQSLVLWSLGIILWWVLRIADDIGPIKPGDLPQLPSFILRLANDLAPFLIAWATVFVLWRITCYRLSASK